MLGSMVSVKKLIPTSAAAGLATQTFCRVSRWNSPGYAVLIAQNYGILWSGSTFCPSRAPYRGSKDPLSSDSTEPPSPQQNPQNVTLAACLPAIISYTAQLEFQSGENSPACSSNPTAHPDIVSSGTAEALDRSAEQIRVSRVYSRPKSFMNFTDVNDWHRLAAGR
ncbi:hypothetical protein RRG08_050134 [Elysia crispata]|uniref:Uncharacterized protein n=1 Tax=Elysia crispata TaxID=231223 RepID=A0AAE0Z6C9_9GAST|nr:hypothetical protein RRG08_050134 [Elysia crispata]